MAALFEVVGDTTYSSGSAAQTAANAIGAGQTINCYDDTHDIASWVEDISFSDGHSWVATMPFRWIGSINATNGFAAGETLSFEGFHFVQDGQQINVYGGTGSTFRMDRCIIECTRVGAANSFFVYQTANTSVDVFNCIFISSPFSTDTNSLFRPNAGITARVCNNTIVHRGASGGAIFQLNNGTWTIANNIMVSAEGADMSTLTGATVWQDYNVVSKAWTVGSGGTGSNNTLKTVSTAGIVAYSEADNGWESVFLTDSTMEVPGTTTPNSIALSTLYTEDVRKTARPNTAAGHAAGASYQFVLPTGGSGGGGFVQAGSGRFGVREA